MTRLGWVKGAFVLAGMVCFMPGCEDKTSAVCGDGVCDQGEECAEDCLPVCNYNGCCEEVDGQWRVSPTDAESTVLDDQPDLSQLPPGVTKPTGLRTIKTKDMTVQSLSSAVNSYKGTDWTASPEYAETIYRLLNSTLDELEESGQWIPAWKAAA